MGPCRRSFMQKHRAARSTGPTLWLAALVGLGCSGQIGSGGGGDRSGDGSKSPGPAGSPVPMGDPRGNAPAPSLPPTVQAMFKPGPATLRRLTSTQYTNTIRDLLGADVTVPGGFEPDTVLSGFASVGASLTTLSAGATEKFEAAAMNLAEQVVSDPARRGAAGELHARGPADDACARSFVTGFGRRAWRRPLTDEEVGRYVALARDAGTALGDFWKGLGYALAGLLQSPHFLYRVELGQPVAGAGQRAFDDWELASRLSFFLWNSTPDDALLDAAQAGAVSTRDGLRKEAAAPARLAPGAGGDAGVLRRAAAPRRRRRPGAEPGQLPRGDAPRWGRPCARRPCACWRTIVLSPDGRLPPGVRPGRDLRQRRAGPAVRPARPGGRQLPARGAAGRWPAARAAGAGVVPGAERARDHHLAHPAGQVRARVGAVPRDPGARRRTWTPACRPSRRATPAPCASGWRRTTPRPATPATAGWIPSAWPSRTSTPSGSSARPTAAGPSTPAASSTGRASTIPRELGALLRKHPDVETCLVRGVYRYALGHIETGRSGRAHQAHRAATCRPSSAGRRCCSIWWTRRASGWRPTTHEEPRTCACAPMHRRTMLRGLLRRDRGRLRAAHPGGDAERQRHRLRPDRARPCPSGWASSSSATACG